MGRSRSGEALDAEARRMQGLGAALRALEEADLASLRRQHAALFGVLPRSKNLPYLRRRLAYRLQEAQEGGLPEALSRDLEARTAAPPPEPSAPKRRVMASAPAQPLRDPRLPEPGTMLVRKYQGRTVDVTVLEVGFQWEGRVYPSLSAVARAVTGTSWNGFLFFGLTQGRGPHER